MNILIINGPNLNMLGLREPDLYGKKTYKDLEEYIEDIANSENIHIECYQSNHEGYIIDKIQSALNNFDGIVINAGGYTHTSIAILDALKAVNIPTVEVHLTDISEREDYRKKSFISEYATKTYMGMGFEGYKKAILYLINQK